MSGCADKMHLIIRKNPSAAPFSIIHQYGTYLSNEVIFTFPFTLGSAVLLNFCLVLLHHTTIFEIRGYFTVAYGYFRSLLMASG